MRLRHAALAATLVAATALPARAEPVDIAHMSCDAFLKAAPELSSRIAIWLDGYFTVEDEPAPIDFDALPAAVGAKLGDYCKQNPTTDLMVAADTVMAPPQQ
jgi:hypothetical protein